MQFYDRPHGIPFDDTECHGCGTHTSRKDSTDGYACIRDTSVDLGYGSTGEYRLGSLDLINGISPGSVYRHSHTLPIPRDLDQIRSHVPCAPKFERQE